MKFRLLTACFVVIGFSAVAAWALDAPESVTHVSAAPVGTYEYVHAPPSRPTNPSQVVVWNASAGTCPTGDESKYLLIVAPNPTGITCRNMRFQGVFLIGATFKGGTIQKQAPSGRNLGGGHINSFTFAQGITVRPFVWISNTYYNSKDWNSWWGDLFGVGTAPGAAEDWTKAMDLYVQKMQVPNGHYGWTSPPADNDPHSDVIQFKFGMVHRVFLGNIDISWNYQTWFLKGAEITGKIGHPQGQVYMNSVVNRGMPAAPEAYAGDGWRKPSYVIVAPGDLANGYQYYYATQLTNVYAVPYGGPGGTNYTQDYIRPDNVPGKNHTMNGNILNPFAYTYPGRAGPMWTGTVTFTNTPPTVVDPAQVGSGVSIDTAEELIDIFN